MNTRLRARTKQRCSVRAREGVNLSAGADHPSLPSILQPFSSNLAPTFATPALSPPGLNHPRMSNHGSDIPVRKACHDLVYWAFWSILCILFGLQVQPLNRCPDYQLLVTPCNAFDPPRKRLSHRLAVTGLRALGQGCPLIRSLRGSE